MKRPAQHIIEEESRKKFALLVPDGWVMNDFQKDYGKDIHIEIFKNFLSTGLIFICQLKGSSQKIVNQTIKIPIEIEMLQYYSTLEQPVLLVCYSTETSDFWAVWANQLIHSFKLRPRQKKVTLTLDAKHLIGESFFRLLETNFNNQIGKKLNIVFTGRSVYTATYKTRLLKWLNKYYKPHFEVENYFLPVRIQIEILDVGDYNHIAIILPTHRIDLTPVLINENLPEIYKPVIKEDPLSAFEAEFLYLFSSLFSSFDLKASLLTLSFVLPQYHGKFKNRQSLMAIGRFAIETGNITEYQRLVKAIIEHGTLEDFQLLNMALFVHDRPRTLIELYRDNLIRAIDKFPETAEKAVLYYNLANYYRHYRGHYLSAVNYQIARRLNSDYLNRFYWWHEYAGVLYMMGHYKIAAAFYQRSIEMDKDRRNLPLTYALRADCLFKSYHFAEAGNLIEDYLKAVIALGKLPSPYFTLLESLCRSFDKFGFDQMEPDREGSVQSGESGVATGKFEPLQDAVNADPLNAHAWYNIGIWLNKEKKYEESFRAFLAAALIMVHDKEAWLNCFWMQQMHGEPEMAMLIMAYMAKQFGDSILNDLTAHIIKDISIAPEEKAVAIAAHEELLKTVKEVAKKEYSPPPEVIRVG